MSADVKPVWARSAMVGETANDEAGNRRTAVKGDVLIIDLNNEHCLLTSEAFARMYAGPALRGDYQCYAGISFSIEEDEQEQRRAS